jgi:hypothetical protein
MPMLNEVSILKIRTDDHILIHSYTSLFYTADESVMSINILSKKEDILGKKQPREQICALVDKAYYVDTISYKIDNNVPSFDIAD